MPTLDRILLAVYLPVVTAIALYGLHRYFLLWLWWRHRRDAARVLPLRPADGRLPRVTVQVPLYNDPAVAERAIDAVCRLDYPPDRLEVQVLDDSTDDTTAIARRAAAERRERGVNVRVIHRTAREGFKAGALAHGLASAGGEFVAVFDSDFVPPPDFLRRSLPPLMEDPRVGLVQARWGHLNRGRNPLTRAQAVFMDGHFAVEQAARSRSGRWFHFNGTAGVWRRSAIDHAGGWSARTLCEDLDLSIRAQMRGWRFVYLDELVCPAELPERVTAFKRQQHRWFKGTVQVALALLPGVWRSDAPWPARIELSCQLLAPFISPMLVLFSLLYFPAVSLQLTEDFPEAWVAGTLLCGVLAGATFYCAGQSIVGRGWWRGLALLPVMVAAGVGIALSNTRGVLAALAGRRSEFERTPKAGDTPGQPPGAPAADRPSGGRWREPVWAWIETGMGVYLACCCAMATRTMPGLIALPLLAMFASGYLWFGVSSLIEHRPAPRSSPAPGPETRSAWTPRVSLPS